MPIISCFFGIYVRMYHNDHLPGHIHVEYQGHEALVLITSGELDAGSLPKAAQRLVKDWVQANQVALQRNWQLAQALEPLELIPGADHD